MTNIEDALNIQSLRNGLDSYKEDEIEEIGVVDTNSTNVVPENKLRKIQSKVLSQTKDYLAKTFGPMGSNTKIIVGNTQKEIVSSYSKDGLKVLRSIINSNPIEASIVEEMIEITRRVEKEVGDGTTSTVILSSLVFDNLINIQSKYNIPPYKLIRLFNEVVDELKDIIMNNKKEATVDDMYDIAMISTNGNTEVAENIKTIYNQFGMDVDISVGISNSVDSYTKAYDGLTITEGMSDPVFINNTVDNTSMIPDAHIYHFADPIDTVPMIELFESIVNNNIYNKLEADEMPIPTVVVCPRISKDMSGTLKRLAQQLYQFDQQSVSSEKPPILIVTNVVASDEIIMDDIANLCGCKSIRKYIDPELHKKDIDAGLAPTPDTVAEFYGKCQLVVSDAKKTKFINPLHMHTEDGEDDPIYRSMINFLESEIKNNEATNNANENGLLKKRLSALKANAVDYLVGGVTISDRDALKDLVEDAVKNCRSASKTGVGYAANFEGLRACFIRYSNESDEEGVKKDIINALLVAYYDISKILYSTVEYDENKVNTIIDTSLELNHPIDISNGNIDVENGNIVKCSIMLDVNILDTLARILSIMVTSNQCLLQAPQLNRY